MLARPGGARKLVVWVALAAVTAAGCKSNQTSPADRLEEVVFYRGPDRSLMITKESVEHFIAQEYGIRHVSSNYRLSVVDLSTGSRIARLVLGDMTGDLEFIGQAGGKLWFYDRRGKLRLHARRPDTLQVVCDERELMSKNPALAGGLVRDASPRMHFFVDPANGALYVTAADGRGFWIDTSTLVARPASGRPDWAASSWTRNYRTYTRSVETSHGLRLKLTGDTHQAVVVERDPASERVSPKATAVSESTFLDGLFIAEADGDQVSYGSALESARGHLFVLQRSKLTEAANAVICSVDPARAFATRWCTELTGIRYGSVTSNGGLAALATVAGDAVVLVTAGRVVALDAESGALRWRLRLTTGVTFVVCARGPERNLMVTGDSIEITFGWAREIANGLSTIDLSTGRRIARIAPGGAAQDLTYLGQAGGKLWFYDGSTKLRLHARRPDTLGVVCDARELVRRNPALSAGLATGRNPLDYYAVDQESRLVQVTTADGHRSWIDPASLSVAQDPPSREHAWRRPDRLRFASSMATRAGRRLTLAGDPRQAIVVEEEPEKAKSPSAVDAGVAPTFLNGNFVTDGVEREHAPGAPIESARGFLFVVHASKLGDGATAVVSAIDPAQRFAVQWSTELPGVELAFTSDFPSAAAVGDLLVLAGKHRAVALDMSSGIVRWRYRY